MHDERPAQSIDGKPKRVLVTGANGFIGRHLCSALEMAGFRVRRAVRSLGTTASLPHHDLIAIGDIGPNSNWTDALSDVQAVVHLAAHVHRPRPKENTAHEYFRVNLEGTRALVTQACEVGVERFIFLSSTKVHGERSDQKPFAADDALTPVDAYGKSKLAAEYAVRDIADRSRMGWVIVRPPLVYGPGVGANFYRLLTLVNRQVPLPFKGIANKRSLVSIGNLSDFLVRVLSQSEALGQTFLISDDYDLSTGELVSKIAESMRMEPLLFHVPIRILEFAGKIVGYGAEVSRLTQSLQLDVSHTRLTLGWRPVESTEKGISRVTEWYLTRRAEQ
jgi:nucleoside-diphosphate-sugar epimerase